jgi:hypothetical protein
MTTRFCFLLLLFLAGNAFSGAPADRIADLQPELKQALMRDDTCVKNSTGRAAPSELESPVVAQQILSGGREAGVIAAPHDDCHCRNGNCSTFVYLKAGEEYKLQFADKFVSLRPMKIIQHGIPSLSGKYQVSERAEETTIFDWTGKQYQPSLCATVTQRKNQRASSIVRHPCQASQKRRSSP